MLLLIAGGCLHRAEWFLYCGSFGPGGRDDRTGRSVRHPAMWPAVLPGGRPDEGGRRAATRWFDLDCKAGADPPRLSGNGVTRMTGVSEANEGIGNGVGANEEVNGAWIYRTRELPDRRHPKRKNDARLA